MRSIVTDRVTWYVELVYRSVCRSVCMSHAKTAGPIEMPFGLRICVGPGNHVLDGVQIPPWEGAILRGKGPSYGIKYRYTLWSYMRKQLNRSRCRLDCWLGLAQVIMNWMGSRCPHEKGQFLGKGSPIVKYRDFLP